MERKKDTLQPEDFRSKIANLSERFQTLRGHLDLASLEIKIQELDKEIAKPNFWEDQERAHRVLKERAKLSEDKEKLVRCEKELQDILILEDFFRETNDPQDLKELKSRLNKLEDDLTRLEIERMLSGEHDKDNAIVYINAGAGGTEAQDWAEMLLRMYLRWAERKGFETQIVDMLYGEEAGIKNVTFIVRGLYAYGYLKCENGIHRLVRISPFDANNRRHTSFASFYSYPEISDNIVVEIKEEDLRIDTFRASGPGGQHVNKTESAVRITHIPTGIVVQCQNERSQHKNKAIALSILKSRLYELEKQKKEEKIKALSQEKKEIAWGSQIRSYILHPYKLVKDHRTKFEVHNADDVLDGNLDGFIKACLLHLTFKRN
ncbi:MAG: peptide chain release factor 2 [Deltaproteobacteria bacterium]|nr:peptide chain release factor 2 [Deltaproteobacteria bacterium]